MLCTHNNIYTSGGAFAAGVFPQDCVPAAAVFGASQAVGQTLFEKGVFGFAEVHYVAWFDAERNMPALWATDLKLEMTRNIASFTLFDFLMRGEFRAMAGRYTVDLGPSPEDVEANTDAESGDGGGTGGNGNVGASKAAKARFAIMNRGKPLKTSKSQTKPNFQTRSYVYSDAIRLRRIARLHYGSFFNLCRLEHISFDLPKRNGTVFQLIDSLSRGIFGMMCVAKTRKHAVAQMWKNLFFIKDQVNAVGNNPGANSRARPHEMDNFSEIVTAMRALKDASSS